MTQPAVAASIDRCVDDLNLTIRDIRSTIFELENQTVGSLRAQVRALVQAYTPILGFAPVLRITGPLDTTVPTTTGEHLLAVLREATSNLARHARASQAEVDVAVSATRLRLDVVDDGDGLPSEVSESGLRNARRRAQELGGTLTLGRHVPRGTALVWEVPLG